MDNCSPHASGHCQEGHSAAPNAASGAKRLLDSTERVQALRSPKKTCVLSHPCSTPDPLGSLLLCSPDSACFQGSFHFLSAGDLDSPIASPSASNCDARVAISLDTTRCFDDSSPDDSLLDPSDSEEENSPFDYAEEEIQKILADDYMESEQEPTRTGALSQSGIGENERDESRSCAGASVTSEDASKASEIAERPNEALTREDSSLSCEHCARVLSDNAGAEKHPQAAPETCVLFDLDIQDLLILSPIDADCEDELPEDSCWEEAGGGALEVIGSDGPGCDNAGGTCVLQESSQGLMSKGQQSLGEHCLGKTPLASQDVSSFSGDHVGRSMPSSGLVHGLAPASPRCSTSSSGSTTCELHKAEKNFFSRKLSSPEDGRDSSEAEQPSDSIQLGDTGVGQTVQEETTSGKEHGKFIPVPQEETRRVCISAVELEQKKHFNPEPACPCEQGCDSYMG